MRDQSLLGAEFKDPEARLSQGPCTKRLARNSLLFVPSVTSLPLAMKLTSWNGDAERGKLTPVHRAKQWQRQDMNPVHLCLEPMAWSISQVYKAFPEGTKSSTMKNRDLY